MRADTGDERSLGLARPGLPQPAERDKQFQESRLQSRRLAGLLVAARRRGIEAKLVLANAPAALDRKLIKSVALGWAWFEEIKAGVSMHAIADREGVTQPRRVAHLVDLAFLAPDIIRSIVEGRQPATLTADRLIKSQHRMLWSDQRAWLSAI